MFHLQIFLPACVVIFTPVNPLFPSAAFPDGGNNWHRQRGRFGAAIENGVPGPLNVDHKPGLAPWSGSPRRALYLTPGQEYQKMDAWRVPGEGGRSGADLERRRLERLISQARQSQGLGSTHKSNTVFHGA